MSVTKQDLATKIERYNQEIKKAREHKEKIFDNFVSQTSIIISEIRDLLSDIPGLTLVTSERQSISPGVSISGLIVAFIGKQVYFTPTNENNKHGIKVIGLYDRELLFECNLENEWKALDIRNSKYVKLSSQSVLDRLTALVPDVPDTSE